MSFESIVIYRDIPVVNGFAQVPANLEGLKSLYDVDLVTPVSGLVVSLSNVGPDTGSGHGSQRFIRIPMSGTAADCCNVAGSAGAVGLAATATGEPLSR